MQVPRANRLGAGNIVVVRLVESHWPDRWSCFNGIRLCPIAPSGRLDGRGLQRLRADRPSDRWGHGCLYGTTRRFEQSEHSSARKDDENICDFPHCCPVQLLCHTSGNVRL